MDPMTIAAMASGAGMIGQGIWSAVSASNQMDFQRNMANTSHQREVADLKAAGLNPVLSANKGAPAPAGAMAPAPDFQAPVSSALQALQVKSQMDANKANIDSLRAKTATEDQVRPFAVHQAEMTAAKQLNDIYESDIRASSEGLKGYRESLLSGYKKAVAESSAAQLQLNKARAESDMYGSKVGHYVLPWLSSAKEAAHTIVPFLP